MTNYYVRETPDGADVLNRISVTFSALVCTCYEVSTAQQIVNALNAQAPPAAVPEGGLRDSVLNSAKFRASCYALVGIVEGIEGLGRNWAANGERLKDTREWVAFYNCVAAMRNGTFNQASAEQAPPAALAVPAVDWRELYRIQTAMRYMDNNPGLTRDHAFSWADQEVADAERAMLAAERNKEGG